MKVQKFEEWLTENPDVSTTNTGGTDRYETKTVSPLTCRTLDGILGLP